MCKTNSNPESDVVIPFFFHMILLAKRTRNKSVKMTGTQLPHWMRWTILYTRWSCFGSRCHWPKNDHGTTFRLLDSLDPVQILNRGLFNKSLFPRRIAISVRCTERSSACKLSVFIRNVSCPLFVSNWTSFRDNVSEAPPYESLAIDS